jgi:hypothetical protein
MELGFDNHVFIHTVPGNLDVINHQKTILLAKLKVGESFTDSVWNLKIKFHGVEIVGKKVNVRFCRKAKVTDCA